MQIHVNVSTIVVRTVLICFLVPGVAAFAQEHPPAATVAPQENPISAHSNFTYRMLQKIVLRAAVNTPEEHYGFKPTDTVRSFGQIVGHVADSQYAFCSAARGEQNPKPGIEKGKTTKGDLIAALKDAFAYCDKAYEGMTDASAAEIVKFHGSDTPKLGVLAVNQVHTVEHYGNLVTYMRMKNLVPPTSDPEFMKQMSR